MAIAPGHASNEIGTKAEPACNPLRPSDDACHTRSHVVSVFGHDRPDAGLSFDRVEGVLAYVKPNAVVYKTGNTLLVFAIRKQQAYTLAERHDLNIDHIRPTVVLDQVIRNIEYDRLIRLIAKLKYDMNFRKWLQVPGIVREARCPGQ